MNGRRTYLFLAWFWSFVRCSKVMVLHIDVTDDVIVSKSVFAWAEEPRLLLRIVWSVLQSSQFVLKVQNVVCLLVSQCIVLHGSNE